MSTVIATPTKSPVPNLSAKSSFLKLFVRNPELKDPTESFQGKTIIVTGANTGLGLAAATKFAQLGASHLILGVRDVDKGNTAKLVIVEQLKGSAAKCTIEIWPLDMLSYQSIKAFSARVSKLDQLDVAVLNAGITTPNYESSPHGWESTLQVNTISTTLLGLLLFPKLKASKKADYTPTLEFVGSGNHWTVTFEKENVNTKGLLETYNNPEAMNDGIKGRSQYARSKLFLMYTAEELAKLAKNKDTGKPDVFVTTVCPGSVKTDLGRHYSGAAFNLLKRLTFMFFRTTEEGSRTLVSGILLGEKGHGQFWKDDTIYEKYKLLVGENGENLRKQVWSELVNVLKVESPEILEVIHV